MGDDLNRHVGGMSEEFEGVHGCFGYGKHNAEEESIFRICVASL